MASNILGNALQPVLAFTRYTATAAGWPIEINSRVAPIWSVPPGIPQLRIPLANIHHNFLPGGIAGIAAPAGGDLVLDLSLLAARIAS